MFLPSLGERNGKSPSTCAMNSPSWIRLLNFVSSMFAVFLVEHQSPMPWVGTQSVVYGERGERYWFLKMSLTFALKALSMFTLRHSFGFTSAKSLPTPLIEAQASTACSAMLSANGYFPTISFSSFISLSSFGWMVGNSICCTLSVEKAVSLYLPPPRFWRITSFKGRLKFWVTSNTSFPFTCLNA